MRRIVIAIGVPQTHFFRVWGLLLGVLLWTPCLHAAKDVEFNVDITCGWDGYYRPMEWTPVEVSISSELKEPFAGSFSLSAQQDGLNTLNVGQTFVLMPNVSLPISLVTKFAFGAGNCDLAIRDSRGRARWRHSRTMWDFSSPNRLLRAVQEQDLLVGLVGSMQFGLMRLPKETACLSSRGQGQVYVAPKLARVAPWDWTGYVSLDLLVLSDPDWSLFKPQQIKAICDWVSNGGSVLLVLGNNPLPQDSPLRVLLPFHLSEPREVEIPPQTMEVWGLDPQQTQTVTAWPLSPKQNVPIPGRVGLGTASLYGEGRVGFGRVAVLAFKPAQLNEAQAGHAAAFWTSHIAACLADGPMSGTDSNPPDARAAVSTSGRTIVLAGSAPEDNSPGQSVRNDNRHRISVAQSASNQVMNHLFQLRQMQPLSIWWVILTLMSLAVLLGPVDYWILKRWDKQPYTWLTSTAWIVVFTVGAYYGVQWLRAGSMELRAVTVLDGVAGGNCAWGTCYAGLFAPRSDDYHLEGLAPNQWWSGIAPMQEELWAHQRESGIRQIHCMQADGGNLPVSLPISIWTVQSLVGEWPLQEMPFSATVSRPSGPRRVEGVPPSNRGQDARDTAVIEITNHSDSPIRMGYVLFQDSCADVGPVEAHATKRFETRVRPFRIWPNQGGFADPGSRGGPPNPWLGMELPRLPVSLSGVTDNAFFSQGCLSRTLGMYSCLDSGAALVCVVFENPPAPFTVKNRSYDVNHIQYARLLVPRAEAKAGE